MRSLSLHPLPVNTARAARTVYNMENLYLAMGDHLNELVGGLELDNLDAFGEKPAYSLFILAMVTLFQYAEGIPDRVAADALRTRLDWKYALHLSLDHPGLQYTSIKEFRQRLYLNDAGKVVFGEMVTRLAGFGLWTVERSQQLDVGTILFYLESLSRVEELTTRMSLALEALASREPVWLRSISLPHWLERYDDNYSFEKLPHSTQELDALAQGIEEDILYLLDEIDSEKVLDFQQMPEVQTLRQLCQQDYQPFECKG